MFLCCPEREDVTRCLEDLAAFLFARALKRFGKIVAEGLVTDALAPSAVPLRSYLTFRSASSSILRVMDGLVTSITVGLTFA